MALTFNGTNVENITYNGNEVKKVTFNGTTVYESGLNDLTGTTWRFNQSTFEKVFSINENVEYNVNVTTTIVEGVIYTKLWFRPIESVDQRLVMLTFTGGSTTIYKSTYNEGTWTYNPFSTTDTYTFTGGTDTTNKTLIDWVKTNGTLVSQ